MKIAISTILRYLIIVWWIGGLVWPWELTERVTGGWISSSHRWNERMGFHYPWLSYSQTKPVPIYASILMLGCSGPGDGVHSFHFRLSLHIRVWPANSAVFEKESSCSLHLPTKKSPELPGFDVDSKLLDVIPGLASFDLQVDHWGVAKEPVMSLPLLGAVGWLILGLTTRIRLYPSKNIAQLWNI